VPTRKPTKPQKQPQTVFKLVCHVHTMQSRVIMQMCPFAARIPVQGFFRPRTRVATSRGPGKLPTRPPVLLRNPGAPQHLQESYAVQAFCLSVNFDLRGPASELLSTNDSGMMLPILTMLFHAVLHIQGEIASFAAWCCAPSRHKHQRVTGGRPQVTAVRGGGCKRRLRCILELQMA
jgi:hypothetical protein